MIIGDAPSERVLRRAGVDSAIALISATSNDIVNLETAMQARAMRGEDLRIVLRLFDDDLAYRVSKTLGNVVSRSVSYLAAPAFAVAMLEHKVLRTIPVGRHVLVIADVRVEPGLDIAGQLLADLERDRLARVLALDPPASPAVEASTLKAAGNLARDQGDLEVAMACHRHAYDLFTVAGDRRGIAAALNNMGAVELDRGDTQAAVAHFKASLDNFTAFGDQWGIARTLGNLAHALRASGQRDDAELAQRYARMSVQAFEQLGDTDGSARSLTTLALILGRSGQHAEGIGMHARAAAIRAQSGDLTGLARSLENIAWSRTSLGDFPVAAWLLGYAETLREESGVGHSSDDRLEYDEAVTHLATVLEPDELESLISAGRRATRDEILHSLDAETGATLGAIPDLARQQNPRHAWSPSQATEG